MKAMGCAGVGAREVAVTVIRSWLAKMWLPTRNLNVVIIGSVLCLAVISAGLTLLFSQAIPLDSPILLGTILMNIHVFAMLTALVVSTAAAQESSAMAWWRTTPLSGRRLGCGLSIPAWAVALAQAILIVPAILVMFAGQDYLTTIVLTCAAIGTGTVAGRLVLVVGRALCQRLSMQSVNKAQIVATIIWIGYLGVSFYVTRQILPAVVTEGQDLSWWAVMGYPLLFYVAASASASAWFWVVVWVTVAALIEILLWSRAGIEKYGNDKAPTLGMSYLSRGPLPVFRLEMVRLLRCPRIQSAISSGYIIQAFLLAVCWKFDLADALSASSENILMLNALLGAYCPAIARGMSDRQSPYAMVMGIASRRWALSVNAGSVMLSLILTLPFLVVWALFLGQPSQFYGGLCLAVFAAAVAGVIGFIMMPSTDTGSVETLAIFLVFVVMAVVVRVLQGFSLDIGQILSLMFIIGLVLVAFPCIIEQARWDGRLKIKSGPSFTAVKLIDVKGK